jgi:hypothetical protein
MSRSKRTVLGPVLMIVGAIFLLGGVALTASIHGLSGGSLTPIGWLIITAVGFLFVHAQMIASLMMVSVAAQNEPAGSPQASDGRITNGKSNEPKTTARP